MNEYTVAEIEALVAFLKAPIWACTPEQLPRYLTILCTGEELTAYAGHNRRRSLSADVWQRETVSLATLVEHARWDAYCAIATIPVEAVRAQFFGRYPAQRERVIIAGTHFDPIYAKTVILAWAPLGEQEADELHWQICAAVPSTIAIVYTAELAAMDLGIPYEQWEPLWARQRLREHVVYVAEDSSYLSAAVGQSARDHRALRGEIASVAEALRENFQQGGDPELVYTNLELFARQCERHIQRYAAVPAETQIGAEEIARLRRAVLTRNTFGAACAFIRQQRARWEAAGQFGELVARVVDRLPAMQEFMIAQLSARWGDLGTTIATAGQVRSMMQRPLPNWAREGRDRWQVRRPEGQGKAPNIHNGRLAHFLDAEAGEDARERERRLNEEIVGQVWLALHEWQGEPHERLERSLKRLRQLVSTPLENRQPQQGDRHGTRALPPEAADEHGGATVLVGGEAIGVSEEQAFIAIDEAVREQQEDAMREQLVALLKAAKLSPQQSAIVVKLYLDARTTQGVVEDLGIPRDALNRQRARALKKLRTFLSQDRGIAAAG